MPSIDINDVVPRGQVTAANGQTIFNYNYILFSQDDLVVIKDGVTLTLSDYTVTGVGNETGGTFVLNVACAGGEIVTHYRQSGLGRGSQYQVDGLLSANPLERDFDRIFTILQEQKRDIDRGVKLDPEDTVSQLILPVTTDRQGKFLAFDSSGNAIASAGTVGDSAIAVSSFMETLLGDPDAATARATLGAAGLASPTFTGTVTIPTLDLTNALSVVDGGTGQSSYTVGDLLYASGTTALSKLAAGTNGHVLTLATGVPTWAAPSAGAMELITTSIASNSTTIDFNNLNSTYDHYIVVMSDVQPATDDAFFRLRTSSNNGSSYDAGAGNYRYSGTGNSTGGVLTQYSSASDTHIALTWPTATAGLSNVSTEAFSGTVTIYKPSGSTNFTQVNFSNAYTPSAASQFISTVGGGCRTAAADVDAIRFLMSSGNIASGTFKLYGVRNA